MQAIFKLLKKVERTFGSMKFAVSIISIFAIALIYGTFMESYHGAEFANRHVYKSWWFMGMQLLMFISIVVATYMRFPLKKRLYGFYTIHTGLIVLFIGSFVTYKNGIDGSLELIPNTPARKIVIDNDFLKVSLQPQNKGYKVPLPFSSGALEMDVLIDTDKKENFIKVFKFLPSAKIDTVWEKTNYKDDVIDHGSRYSLFNNNVSQEFTMSLNQNSDFKSSMKLGLLQISYMPKNLFKCFVSESKSGYVVWNTLKAECYTPEERKIPIIKTSKGNEFIAFKDGEKIIKFFPNFSPLPVKDDLTKEFNSPYRVFSKKMFQDKPNLFLFGESVAYYKKRKKKWVGATFSKSQKLIKLPWMQFNLRLLEHKDAMVPFESPTYTRPIQDNGNIIQGEIKAVQIGIWNKTKNDWVKHWVRSDAPLALNNGQSEIRFQMTKKEIKLPYQITLKNFKMDTNPGTNDPASYESFVDLLDGRVNKPASNHHVYMNEPLKYDDFTFYQASYFQVGQNMWGSVFSVNYDPGRPLKYAGSLLLVLGSIWHYVLRRKKTKVKHKANA